VPPVLLIQGVSKITLHWYVAVLRVFRKRLHLKAYKLSIVRGVEHKSQQRGRHSSSPIFQAPDVGQGDRIM
jgi:hypothetical protein